MHRQPLIAGPVIPRSAEQIGADEHAAIGPPERDLVPRPAVPDGDAGERAQRPLRNNVVPDTEASGESGAVAVVPVEQLEDARGCPGRADPLLDTVSVDGIDHPDAAVLDEGVRATLHELVDDPAEAAAELVAKAGPHSAELTATPYAANSSASNESGTYSRAGYANVPRQPTSVCNTSPQSVTSPSMRQSVDGAFLPCR